MRPIPLRNWLLGLLIAIPLGYALFFQQLIRCQLIRYSADYKALHDSTSILYVSRNTPQKVQLQVVKHNRRALQRLRTFWLIGPRQAIRGKAILIYCHTEHQYQQLCGSGSGESSAGCSLGAPWGESYLILGPSGNNTDVIAHERCHDELFARVGWWQVNRQIPQWFNEGLALMVDYRFSPANATPQQRFQKLHDEWLYRSQSGQEAIALSDLETMRDFFEGSYYHVMLAYLTSAAEVARWLTMAGQSGLVKLTEQVQEGTPFAEVYRALDTRPNKSKRPKFSNTTND